MIQKINVHLSIGYANASRNEVIEVDVPDDCTPQEADDIKDHAAEEWAQNWMDPGWSDVK